MNLFLEPNELIEKINKGHNLKILDATFFLPNSNLNAEDEFNKEHIPNAIFFDINKIKAKISSVNLDVFKRNIFRYDEKIRFK